MQLSILCHLSSLVSLFSQSFASLSGRFFWISLTFHTHLRRTAKPSRPVGAGGRRWKCLGGRLYSKLPGWAHQRGRSGHLPHEIRCPRESTCGRASAVVRTMTWQRACRRTGCDFVFESFPWRKSFRFSCEVHFPCEVSSHSNGPICWVPLQGR